MSTTGALITIMAVKLQMLGGEICHVHVKVDHKQSRKQQTKITHAARARTLNRLKKLSWDTGIRSLSSFSLDSEV